MIRKHLAAAIIAAVCLPATAANLFSYVPAAKSAKASELLFAPTPIRMDAQAINEVGVGGVLDAAMPDGKHLKIRIDDIETHANGDVSWRGKVVDSARDLSAGGTIGATATYAQIETAETEWGIAPSFAGHDWIFDKTQTELLVARPGRLDDAKPAPIDYSTARPKATCPAVSGMPSTKVTIDVLAVVAPDFVATHGGAAGAETRLNYLFSKMNEYLANSNVAITYRRVATMNASYQAASTAGDDDDNALDALTYGQGTFANVPALKRYFGADMVAMFRGAKGNSISGIAWVNGDRNGNIGTGSLMYSVVGDATWADAIIAAHELGHNLGNNHDRPNASTQTGSTPYAYGHYVCGGNAPGCGQPGFNSSGTGFGTIMTYQRPPQVLKFSSPSLTCQGTAGGISAPCGVPDQQDDVRAMNCVRSQVAALAPSWVGGCNLATDSDRDGIPDCIEAASGKSAAAKDNDVFGSGLLFAAQQYRDFLAREGDADGLNFWTTSLAKGSQTRAQMVQGFLDSAEFQGVISPVVRLYFAYFLRIPDYDGLQHWIAQSKAGMSLSQISQNFASSAEFAQRYGSLNNTQFVTLVYNNVLARSPDAQGLAFWVGQLAGGASRGSVMMNFSESAEYKAVINSEVYVTMSYMGMLRRAPDPAGFNFWTSQLDGNNNATSLISGFLNSPEYRQRFLP